MAMNMEDMVDKLRRRLPDAPSGAKTDDLLEDLIGDAQDYILGYTGRTELPEQLYGACVKIAAIEYNRLGMEGETGHSEGSTSRTAEMLPSDIRAQLLPFVLARTVRA